jgi:hypothetical protein
MKNLSACLLICAYIFNSPLFSQQLCTDTTALYTFEYNGNDYAIVKDQMTWDDAQSCSFQLGGALVNIDTQEEQDAIWSEIPNAGIINSNTSAPDGGQAAYLWLGASDSDEEGKWVWNGTGGQTTQFWQGDVSGSAVGGLYNNFGTSQFGGEPDNYLNNQDGLGMALSDWPYGVAGEWNDLDKANLLYFIVEILADTSSGGGSDTTNTGGGSDTTNTGGGSDTTNTGGGSDTTSIWQYQADNGSSIFPNPMRTFFEIKNPSVTAITLINTLGQNVLQKEIKDAEKVNISKLKKGIYFVIVENENNKRYIEKIRIE